MAIPFNLPTNEQTEDNYRILDQLLLDLFRVLRQILLRRPTPPTEQRGHRDGAEGPAAAEAGAPAPSGSRQVGALPDIVVSCTLSYRCRRRRRRHRRRRRSRCARPESPPPPSPDQPPSLTPRPQPDNWMVDGLRRLAEDFQSPFRDEAKDKKQQRDQDQLQLDVKTSGYLSLLMTPQASSCLWTTVVLLMGWRLLVRAR